MDDVGAIEELISKVKKTENNLKESLQQEAALEYRQYERFKNNKTVNGKTPQGSAKKE